jgi:hypothetical protein
MSAPLTTLAGLTAFNPTLTHFFPTYRVLIAHAKGRYTVYGQDGSVLASDVREPLLAAARALAGRPGFDPHTVLEMSRVDTPTRVDMRGRLDHLAGLAVQDNCHGTPTFVPFRPSKDHSE